MNADRQPLVSILTPVYNGAAYLRECIESVLTQTYSNYEYIIINNRSTDETLSIALEYAKKDTRIRVHSNETFVGVIDNHNIAFRLMSPEARYCKVVSADDYIFPNCVGRMVELAEANPSVGIVGCYQLSGSVVKWLGFRHPTVVMPGREVGRQMFLNRQVFIDNQPLRGFGSPTSLMYRGDVVRESAAFYPNSSPHSDTSACFQVLENSDFGFVYDVLCYERTHGETQTSTSLKLNRYLSQTLNDLKEYGSFYLSEQELKGALRLALQEYRRFLALNYVVRRSDGEFWSYHRGRLDELGFPITRWVLFKAAVEAGMRELVNPGQALAKLQKHLSAVRVRTSEMTRSGSERKKMVARC